MHRGHFAVAASLRGFFQSRKLAMRLGELAAVDERDGELIFAPPQKFRMKMPPCLRDSNRLLCCLLRLNILLPMVLYAGEVNPDEFHQKPISCCRLDIGTDSVSRSCFGFMAARMAQRAPTPSGLSTPQLSICRCSRP